MCEFSLYVKEIERSGECLHLICTCPFIALIMHFMYSYLNGIVHHNKCKCPSLEHGLAKGMAGPRHSSGG
jgi:hypothetical protein